ncbi:MOSC domain-containing protein [Ensifer sp. NPDC090286]|uniref:MOSC domain-containing protein n=1 Tax=Ensifer sp. NPDC090286 TaxID=3363991 RepID=UPI00383BA7DA
MATALYGIHNLAHRDEPVPDSARVLKVLAVCVGKAEGRPGKKAKTGINKHPTNERKFVGGGGVEGDAVCNQKHHGGPEQAVYVEGDLTRLWWQNTLNRTVDHGLFGENLCFEGLDSQTVAIGDRFIVGDLVMEATAPRMPCRILGEKMRDMSFPKLYKEAARAGFYCRVIRPGPIITGALVRHLPFAGERILMPEMMAHYGQKASPEFIARCRAAPVHARLRASLNVGVIKF